MSPYGGHLQGHRQFWPLDQIASCLIHLAMLNHAICHSKFHTLQICNVQVIEGQSEEIVFSFSFSFLFKRFIRPLICLCFEHMFQSRRDMWLVGVQFFCWKLVRCPIKKRGPHTTNIQAIDNRHVLEKKICRSTIVKDLQNF